MSWQSNILPHSNSKADSYSVVIDDLDALEMFSPGGRQREFSCLVSFSQCAHRKTPTELNKVDPIMLLLLILLSFLRAAAAVVAVAAVVVAVVTAAVRA